MTTISLHRSRGTVVFPRADAVTAKPAFVAAVAAVPPITILHLGATAQMEPAGWTISDYVVGVPNGVGLYAMTAGALAIGGAVLARALRVRPGTAALRVLLSVWSVAVVLTAAFPTNVRGTAENLSSTIHLIAGAVVFAVLPVVGWMLSRSPLVGRGGVWLRWTSLVAGVLSAALILNRLPGVVGMPELMLPPGILQRAAGAVLIVLLAVAACTVFASGINAEVSAEVRGEGAAHPVSGG